MSLLSSNLKYLRKKSGLSQQNLAEDLGIPRTTLGDYERAHTEPSLDMLEKISDIFHVAIDPLLKQDLSLDEFKQFGNDQFKVLAITVDQSSRENIELVESKARAGYLDNFQNPEFIRDLPKFHFPSIPQGTFRGFEIAGDSMLPIQPGSIVISQYVERVDEVKPGKTYVVVTQDEGIVYKRLYKGSDANSIELHSDNEEYAPYTLHIGQVAEIWQYYAHLSFSDDKVDAATKMEEKLNSIHQKVNALHAGLLTGRD